MVGVREQAYLDLTPAHYCRPTPLRSARPNGQRSSILASCNAFRHLRYSWQILLHTKVALQPISKMSQFFHARGNFLLGF